MTPHPSKDIDFKDNNPFADQILRKGGECKFCNSQHIVKHGRQNGKQRYLCRECGKKFVDPDGLTRMRNEKQVIALALDLYYEGLSFRKTRRMIKKIYHVTVDASTIWRWIQKYTPLCKQFIQSLTPRSKNGDFHCDETWIKSKRPDPNRAKTGFWYWDSIDRDSRYIMGTSISKTRGEEDATAFFNDFKTQYKAIPKRIIVDGLPTYWLGLKKSYGYRTAKKQIDFISKAGIAKSMPSNNNRIERYHNEIKDRTKIMRGMQNPLGILDGLAIHHNYIRPHMTLKTTPARIAGIRLPINPDNGWGDLIRWSTYHQTLSS